MLLLQLAPGCSGWRWAGGGVSWLLGDLTARRLSGVFLIGVSLGYNVQLTKLTKWLNDQRDWRLYGSKETPETEISLKYYGIMVIMEYDGIWWKGLLPSPLIVVSRSHNRLLLSAHCILNYISNITFDSIANINTITITDQLCYHLYYLYYYIAIRLSEEIFELTSCYLFIYLTVLISIPFGTLFELPAIIGKGGYYKYMFFYIWCCAWWFGVVIGDFQSAKRRKKYIYNKKIKGGCRALLIRYC